MLYKVTMTIHELVEAENENKAQEEFCKNFDWSDLKYGDYTIELCSKEEDA